MGAVSAFHWEGERPQGLREPVLVAAFAGWNDAGEAATGAVRHLSESSAATRVADVDPEVFFDFQSHRPRITVTGGVVEGPITYPGVEVWTAREADPGLILIRGVEPSMRWRTLCGDIVDLAATAGVRRVVTLGALLADVPHTRPVRVSTISSPAEITAQIGGRRPDYHGPTGIITVLHATAVSRGLEAASLWAAVPHYVGGGASPTASLALLQALGQITRIRPDVGALEREIVDYHRQIEEAIKSSPQAEGMIQELERNYDERADEEPMGQMSGDAIAAEFERFLREQSPPEDEPRQ